jgi:hypothetical protein
MYYRHFDPVINNHLPIFDFTASIHIPVNGKKYRMTYWHQKISTNIVQNHFTILSDKCGLTRVI